MKILYINSVYGYGSTGNIVRDLMNYEAKSNEVFVCYGRYKTTDNNDGYIGSKLGFMNHLGQSMFLGRHGLSSTQATKRLIKHITTFQPDIIHLHNLHGYYINVPYLFEYLKNHPEYRIIWTLHDCWSVSGSSAYFSYSGCKEWDEGCVVCNTTLEYPKSYGIKRQKQNFAWKKRAFTSIEHMEIVTPSYWLSDLMKTTFLNKYKINTIYNGIDLEIFKPYDSSDNEKLTLLGVANIWEKRKGLDDFYALAKHYGKSICLILVGLTEKQLENLPDNIMGITRTNSPEELAKLYSQADIYLNLSVEETMGLTTVEAIACGTPVIVYDQTAVPEMVTKEVGEVVPAQNLDALIKCIDSFDYKSYDTSVLRNYVQQFSKEKMLQEYSELYQNILKIS